MIGVYEIHNLVSGKKYIGQSINVEQRLSQHKYNLRNTIHTNERLQTDWQIYGENNFEFSILEYCDKENLNYLEIYYIQKFNTFEKQNGYNLTKGGDYNIFFTNERKEKMMYEQNNNKPIYQIDLLGNIINEWNGASQIQRELGFSKKLISLCCKNKQYIVYGFFWKYVDDYDYNFDILDVINYICKSSYNPIVQLDYHTEELIKVWPKQNECREHFKISRFVLESICNGSLNTKYKKYKFKYLKDYLKKGV